MGGKFLEERGSGEESQLQKSQALGGSDARALVRAIVQVECISEIGVCMHPIDLQQGRKTGFIFYDNS